MCVANPRLLIDMPKAIRVASKTAALAMVLLGGIYLGFFFHNNYGPDQIESDEYAASMRRATGWLLDHREDIHFLYGLSCDMTLGEHNAVRQQMSIDYCPQQHPFSPACLTHQLMGFRFMQRYQCGETDDINRQVASRREVIARQLWLDPRVVDVYLQRVLMLVEGSGTQSVRDRWIRRILDNQMEDGGWGDMQPLVQLGSVRVLGFARNAMVIGTPRSNFHATAQGLWLMALLDRRREDS